MLLCLHNMYICCIYIYVFDMFVCPPTQSLNLLWTNLNRNRLISLNSLKPSTLTTSSCSMCMQWKLPLDAASCWTNFFFCILYFVFLFLFLFLFNMSVSAFNNKHTTLCQWTHMFFHYTIILSILVWSNDLEYTIMMWYVSGYRHLCYSIQINFLKLVLNGMFVCVCLRRLVSKKKNKKG